MLLFIGGQATINFLSLPTGRGDTFRNCSNVPKEDDSFWQKCLEKKDVVIKFGSTETAFRGEDKDGLNMGLLPLRRKTRIKTERKKEKKKARQHNKFSIGWIIVTTALFLTCTNLPLFNKPQTYT